MLATGFKWQDYVVFAVILLISAGIGIWNIIRGGNRGTITEYLLANRKLKWLPVGLSILVTFQSAILFIGVPAEVYTYGTSYLLFHIGMALSVLISALVFVPLLFPLKLTSVYEYLERRFQSKLVRMIGSGLGMMNMCLYMGVVLFAPATAIEAVSSIPVWFSILVIGLTATLYTTLGGLRAVIWTDVFQFCVMSCGLIAILIQGCIVGGGLGHIWEQATNGGRIDFGSLSPDPRVRHSVWALVVGGTLTWLANIGVNQSNVQRFSSVPSLTAAKCAVLVSLPGFVVFGCLGSLVGIIVYSYFVDQGCDPIKAQLISNPNQLVPLFVVDVFKNTPGFAGLFLASLVAASLSTVSSSINSLGAMLWEDMLKWKFKATSEQTSTKIVKIFVLLFGFVAIVVAYLAMQLGGPATQIALGFFGASGGPLLGMFLLGALCSKANWIGVSLGAVISLIFCLWLAIGKYSIPPYPTLPGAPTNSCEQYELLHSNGIHNDHANISNGAINSTHSRNGYYTALEGVGDPSLGSGYNKTVLLGNQCHLNSSDHEYQGVLHSIYSISYLWYSTIGVFIVFTVGMFVSLITERCNFFKNSRETNTELLLIPPARQCCSKCSQKPKAAVTASSSTNQNGTYNLTKVGKLSQGDHVTEIPLLESCYSVR